MRVAIALFEGVTALDAIGPYEVLQRLPGATVSFLGHPMKVTYSEKVTSRKTDPTMITDDDLIPVTDFLNITEI